MSPDRLGFQELVIFLAIAPHHRDRANLNFITHTGSNHILKPDGARFLIFFQHVFSVRLLKSRKPDNRKLMILINIIRFL
jgi:hypothetical protein